MIKKLSTIILLLPIFIFAQYERPGSSSAQFLKIAVSPRAAGMGDSYISISEGAEATHYNTAALALIKNTDLAFSHTKWFAGINHEFASAAHTFSFGTLALSYTSLYTDEMKVRTPLQSDGTGETFYAGCYRVGASYARFLTDKVTFGTTVNYINVFLYSGFTANAVAVDIATLYTTELRNFRFGIKISNFGSEIKFVNESYPLPTNFTFGLSMNALEMDKYKLLLSMTAIKPNDVRPIGLIGTELNYQDLFFLRTGYRFNHEVAKYSYGAGLKMNINRYQLHFDYSYSDSVLLGGTHCLGIRYSL